MTDTDTLAPVTLSDSAVRRVAQVLAKEAPGSALRIAVNGGGCSGFSYAFDVTTAREPDDLVLARDGAIVLVDSVSLEYLAGSEIDFADDLIGQSFKIHNPNATSSCGCGTSFSL
jgi:iron-sulfur cluster insertion protein